MFNLTFIQPMAVLNVEGSTNPLTPSGMNDGINSRTILSAERSC
jgi:hypothetical protein